MKIRRVIGEKGQIVVPKDIREHLGIKPGTKIIFEVKEKEVILRPFKDPKQFVEEFCTVPKKLTKKIDIEKIREKQIEEEYRIH
ncbi:MAG: AbrB/MazE/SpoVT family DNA-binding domain-containing protein [Euryarchaeota archaeon]|nr:AbrB/MazE/SpoVT family DNA-binding domain-containing protein [Euryarchaeota archaeon]